jgi:lysophospholipase L1-like esterase
MKTNGLSRRGFIRSSGIAVGAAAALSQVSTSRALEGFRPAGRSMIAKGDVVLFQGDSITDAGRSRENAMVANKQPGLGTGYSWLAAAELLVDRQDDALTFYNRGVSGNKVYQLAERWKEDCLELKPNVLSILIGVNDLWHKLNGKYEGTLEIYEHDYMALLERTRKALPRVKLVICEPFVLRCGAVNEKWFPEFDSYRAAARKVAKHFRATFVPFQAMFDEAVKYAPPEHWAKDGVHPTPAGAALMAHLWTEAVDG